MGYKIQRVARSLNRLLNIQGGVGPLELNTTVVPIVDVQRMYDSDALQTSGGTASGAGAINGAGAGLTSSSTAINEFMWIYSLGGILTLGAAPGTNVTWTVNIRIPSTGTDAPVGSGQLATHVAAESIRFGVFFGTPLLLRSGSSWSALVHGDAGGADHNLTVVATIAPAASF